MLKLKERLLTIAIAVIFVMFVAYGISTFYPEPRYEEFCGEQFPEQAANETACLEKGGRWSPNFPKCPPGESCPEGWCDIYYKCNKEFQNKSESYNRVVFIVSGIIGLIAVVIGVVFLKLESVGSGIMGGGVLTIVYGTIRYWGNLQDIGRFAILGIILAVLIGLGYKIANHLKK
ncbi:MAG TPA: hypothetical protein VJI46_00225 [Candidatus Nanoarchaeia archaeon]|nr:hypothetical protein [Candidatus Nanoarchaeia archaeon]